MTEFSWWQIYFLSEWVIRVVMLVMIPPRRSPQAAKSWLILILFIPWPGLLVYWLVGRLKLPKWRHEQFARVPQVLGDTLKVMREKMTPFVADTAAPWREATHLARSLGYFRPMTSNSAETLTDYDEGLRKLRDDIDNARQHVHLLFYIFAYDKATVPIIEALERAVKRGVKCRVLYDAVGSGRWKSDLLPALKEAGVEAREMMPVSIFFGKSLRADLRNHRKIVVIDADIGYTGSQNLVDSECGDQLFNEELMVRVLGPVVAQLQFIFISDWYLETEVALKDADLFRDPTPAGNVVAQVLPSGPDFERQNNEHLIISLCHQAKKRIVMTTPYMIPSEALIQALQAAVLRGVQVHLFLSEKSDNFLTSWAQASYYEELLEAGVRIYLYQRKFLHAKHMVFDDQVAWIGSSNLDIRSFELNAEINILFYGPEVPTKMAAIHARYMRHCEPLELKNWLERPYLIQITENLARLWSPLL